MAGGRNPKRPRSVPKKSSATNEVTRKFSKKEPAVNISTITVTDSHLCLLDEEKDCDVTFLVGPSNERIQCHQLFLKARSPVFQAMFSGRWSAGNKEIKIPDIDPVTFRAFLKILYADKLVTALPLALDLIYVAQKYDVQLLVQKCEDLFKGKLILEDCVEVIQRGRAYGNENLVKIAGDTVARANSWEDIAIEEVLRKMDKETLAYLLKRDDLRAKEVELFKIAVEWGKIQVKLGASSAVNEGLADIVPLIRFPIMTLNEFTTVVAPTALLPESALVQIFSYFGSDESTQKDLAKNLNFSTVPRKAVPPGALVSFYEGPVGREEISVGTGLDLDDYIPSKRRAESRSLKFRVNIPVRRGNNHSDRRSVLSSSPRKVTISGIVLHFPVKEDRSGNPSQDPSNTDLRNFFKISIVSSPRGLDYAYSGSESDSDVRYNLKSETVLVISPVKYEWGTVMEVKVEPSIVLDNWNECLIKLQQVARSYEMHRYRYQSFGSLKHEELDLGSDEVRVTDVKTRSRGLRIIHKIRFSEQ